MKKRLPINDYSLEIACAVLENQVTIIEAETGAGKTTQIPQILFNSGLFDGIDITITQPRVMPTISVAHRVAEELGENVGYSIGYKTRHEKTEYHTPVTYMTDGYCLSTYGTSSGEKIVIIDEAHEFNLNIETLLGLYKKELNVNPDLKLVVMSATMDSQKISRFFNGAHIISIPGKTYPVERLWEPSMTIVDCISKYFNYGTNMLVFLSGKAEIDGAYNALTEMLNSDSNQLPAPQVFKLHGEMAYEEQKVVFEHYEEGKIVLATNVAQTSITIPDIDFVIDAGTCKEMVSYDGVSMLSEIEISQADCSQRAGRAGRCKPGTYVLCSSLPFGHRQNFSKPEIQRISLENLVLKLATMGLDPLDIEFVHNPDRSNLTLAKNLLKKIGALNKDGSITEIGRHMETMPVSARIARMLIEARKYSPEVQGDMAIVAAIFECGDFRGREFWAPLSDCAECNKSDLTYQLSLFKTLNKLWKEASFEERKTFYKDNRIKRKVFQGILKVSKDIADKLSLKYTLYEDTHEDNYSKIRKCILSAYADSVYVFYSEYPRLSYSAPGSCNARALNRSSVLCSTWYQFPKLVVAQPLNIASKQGYYGPHTIELLTNVTAITPEADYDFIETNLLPMAHVEYFYSGYDRNLHETWTMNNRPILHKVSNKVPNFVRHPLKYAWDVVIDGQVIDTTYRNPYL